MQVTQSTKVKDRMGRDERKRQKSLIMSHTNSHDSNRIKPVIRSGRSRSRTKIESLTIEEICKRLNIQSNMLALQSRDKGQVKSALHTLSTITRLANRKDALYVLVGYYRTEIRTIDEIIDFFYCTEMAYSVDLAMMVLKDLVKFKDISKQRIFVTKFLRHLSMLFLRYLDEERKKEVRTLIENSVWGYKLKRKFLDNLFYENFRDEDLWES